MISKSISTVFTMDKVDRNNDYVYGLSHNGRNYAEFVKDRISEEYIEGNLIDFGPGGGLELCVITSCPI